MLKLIKKVSKTMGMRPGAMVYVGEKRAAGPAITLVDYDEESITEKDVASIEECLPFRDSPTVTWVNIDGVHETEVIEKAGGIFGMHPLVLEDIVNTGQRPKLEDFDDYLYVTLKMLRYDEDSGELGAEHISLILGRSFVISFQEEQGDVFDPVRERIRKSKGRIRKSGPDYLLYALVDAVVDNYFVMLEKMAAKIEKLEDELLEKASPETSHAIHRLKTDLIFLRKSVWPLRELVSGLEKSESDLVHRATVPYLRDLYDHTIQVMDTIESLRDMVSGMLDIYCPWSATG